MNIGIHYTKLSAGLLALLALSICSCQKQAQKGAPDITDIAEPVTTPGWIKFKPEAKVNPRTVFSDHFDIFHLPPGNEMRLQSEETDDLGLTSLRFQQFFKTVEVENAEFRVRARDNVAISANGHLAYDFQPETTAPQIPEDRAWSIVHERIPAERYFGEDNFLADFENQNAPNREAYRPKGKLLFTEVPNSPAAERKLAWMFKVYVAPLDRSRQIYVDAGDGSIIKELPLFPTCYWGSGPVSFRGTKSINTQKKGDRYYLNDDCDGTLLSAGLLDAASKPVDISDDDNNWAGNNPSVVTSYWGLRASYDYFWLIHGRRSYDGKNARMAIWNDPGMRDGGHNATGGGGSIRIGLANAGNDNDDYNTLDIVGHEFTHSVIEKSANLTYDSDQESAALDESFCDIFGQMAEQWIEGGTQKDWIIGDDKGCGKPYVCRDLQNPNSNKPNKHPAYYKGNFWQSAPGIDPHGNGGVQNRWFTLICDGGSGTTEKNEQFNVTGLGMVKGRKIAYRTLTQYLGPASDYVDARNGSISAAEDLFGVDSSEVGEVTKAWCAVGVCPYGVPKQPDRFDQAGGNPNPASPNNNNSLGGATPIGNGTFSRFSVLRANQYYWSEGPHPKLVVTKLSIYPFNDVDYFNISFPQVQAPGGRCFSSGFSFNCGTPVNARVFLNGNLYRSFVNSGFFTVPFDATTTGNFVLEISAPFPGQILDYSLEVAFYLHYRSDCFQPGLPNLWDEIRNCPMCDAQILNGFDRVILEPSYRQPEQVAARDHYFYWNGEGALQIPMSVLQGNDLHVEVVNQAGQTVATADRTGEDDVVVSAPRAPAGVYSLRFSGFGNGTEILLRTPRQ